MATLLLALFAACSSERPDESSTTETFSQALTAGGLGQLDVYVPTGVDLGAVAVGSTWGLTVHDNGRVLASADGGVPVIANRGLTAPQTWQNKTELKAQSIAPIVYSGIDAYVNSNAVISDLLHAPALLPQAGSNVPRWEDGIPEFQTFSRGVQFPSLPDTWLSVERGQTQELAPGNYGNYSVKDGGVLELSSGRYYFRSLGAEPNSTLRVKGPAGGVYIYVKGDFTFRGVQSFEDSEQEMMVVSFAQQVYIERPFEGVIMAPEGTLALGGTTGQTFTGQFFGAYVEIRNGATIGLRPFSYGPWDDADECGWGADEGAECEYDVACPGQGERRCHETACACQVQPGTYIPSDGCGSLQTEASGLTWLHLAQQGTACEPSYLCSGEGLCDQRGYCECTGALAGDGSECTEPSDSSSDVIRPVTDGTSCSGDGSSTCTAALACAGGVCACPDPIVSEPDGPHPACLQAVNSGLSADVVCHTADCAGGCDLLGDGTESSPSGIPAPSRSQHTMRAFNLKVDDSGESAFAREEDGVRNGTLFITDHIGVNAWADEEADYMTPAEGYELTSEAFEAGEWVEVPMKLEYDTAVHWFKIATPGEYVFSANPLHNVPSEGPSADNGLKVQVYEATELSSPGYPTRGEVLEVPPRVVSQRIGSGEIRVTVDEWIPGVRQARFSPASFPIYVKVFATEPDKIRARQGNYIFRARRVSCASEEEACNLVPWAVVLDDIEAPAPTSPEDTWTKLQGGEGWFKFNIERPDSALIGQGLKVFVVEPLPGNPDDTVSDNVALLDAETGASVEDVEFVASTETYNGEDWVVWSYAESAYQSTEERPLNDRAASGPVVGHQYLLRVQKKPTVTANDPWYVMPGYTTTLTWMHGTPYSPSDCEIDCKETQEVGNDEIYMAVNVGGPGNLQTWIPDDMGLVGGGDKEAKDGVKFATIDERDIQGWSNRFFKRIEIDHQDGTSYKEVPALGSGGGDFQIGLCEDDRVYDECDTATYWADDLPKQPTFTSPKKKIKLDSDAWSLAGDGSYVLMACGMSHYLGVRTCESDADCTPPTTCDGQGCR